MLGTQQTALYGNVMNSVKEFAVTKTPVKKIMVFFLIIQRWVQLGADNSLQVSTEHKL